MVNRLEQLSSDARAIVRADALHRLPGIDPTRAAMPARRGLADPDAGVRAAAAHVLALVGDRTDLHAIEVHLGDEAPDVRVAVLGAMAQLGDADARRQVSEEVTRLGSSSDSSARCSRRGSSVRTRSASEIERGSLGLLIHDDDEGGRRTRALAAVRSLDDRGLLDEIVSALGRRATAAEAGDALVRLGEAALPLVDRGLAHGAFDPRVQVHLARVGRDIGGPAAAAILWRHVRHPDREVGPRGAAIVGDADRRQRRP